MTEAPGLPLPMDTPPREARLVDALPAEPGWQFEPKWDGFRCLAFRDGSRVADAVSSVGGGSAFVLDGEIVAVGERGLDFACWRSLRATCAGCRSENAGRCSRSCWGSRERGWR